MKCKSQKSDINGKVLFGLNIKKNNLKVIALTKDYSNIPKCRQKTRNSKLESDEKQ